MMTDMEKDREAQEQAWIGRSVEFAYPGHGYPHDQKTAADAGLEVGKVYTVSSARVYNWSTTIFLREMPGAGFNSVLFRVIDGAD